MAPWPHGFFYCHTCGIPFFAIAFALPSHPPVTAACPMENKRDAASAGLAGPTNASRNSQNPSLPDEPNIVASSSSDPTSPPSGILTSSTTGNDALAPSGMYTAAPHPAAPFPEPDHPHPTPHRHVRFTERVVHQIHFKIFTHSNNERELFIEEIPTTGISRTRDPEHFFYGLSGQWEWSKQTADYWRHHFELPLHHGNTPFRNDFMATASPSGEQGQLPTISTLARQLSESLSAAAASGNLATNGEWWSA